MWKGGGICWEGTDSLDAVIEVFLEGAERGTHERCCEAAHYVSIYAVCKDYLQGEVMRYSKMAWLRTEAGSWWTGLCNLSGSIITVLPES